LELLMDVPEEEVRSRNVPAALGAAHPVDCEKGVSEKGAGERRWEQ
jgi:hypothetical protein